MKYAAILIKDDGTKFEYPHTNSDKAETHAYNIWRTLTKSQKRKYKVYAIELQEDNPQNIVRYIWSSDIECVLEKFIEND